MGGKGGGIRDFHENHGQIRASRDGERDELRNAKNNYSDQAALTSLRSHLEPSQPPWLSRV